MRYSIDQKSSLLRRRGFTEDQVNEISSIYRILYMSRLNNSDAIAKVEQDITATPERDIIVDFVKASKRGIVRIGI